MMKNQKSGRKPQIELKIDQLNLDKFNPRLLPYLPDPTLSTQFDLTSILHKYFDTEVIAMSMVENGYFDEEPIICVPDSLPEGFNFSGFENVDNLASALQKLPAEQGVTFTVVEGNRRVSTIKMLTDPELRTKMGIDRNYPTTSDQDILDDISSIPCIIYETREEVSAYLGVRHIAGLLKWEAFAKAAYIANFVESEMEEGSDVNESIKQVQKVVGDRSDTLRKQYVTYKLFLQARDDIGFDVKPIINRFSLLTVAYNSAPIRDYIGVKSYSKVDLTEQIVPTEKLGELRKLLTWIYGDKSVGESPILTDSRKITNTLSHIVQNDSAIQYLEEYKDLEGAYDRTGGEKEYLTKKLTGAIRAVQTSLGFAYKYKNDVEIISKTEELESLIEALKSNLSE